MIKIIITFLLGGVFSLFIMDVDFSFHKAKLNLDNKVITPIKEVFNNNSTKKI